MGAQTDLEGLVDVQWLFVLAADFMVGHSMSTYYERERNKKVLPLGLVN